MRSRNAREGHYVGAWEGTHVRTWRPLFIAGRPDADMAWACLSKRYGAPLAPRRPRCYLSKAQRAAWAVGQWELPVQAERQAFGAWLARPRRGRLTGWLAWCASLDHRGVAPVDIAASRSAFDRYARDWREFDAWCAAAWWARIGLPLRL